MSYIKKYNYIDTMRGVAILLVVLCHCAWYLYQYQNKSDFLVNLLTRGQIGVQLFFVASALTLCLSMENRGDEPRSRFNFYIRRLFRIAPIYYIGIIIYFALNFYTYNRYNPQNIQSYTPAGILSNAFFLNGFIPKYNNTIVPGGWSIGTEMAFYLCFPFLFKWLREKSFLYILSCITAYSIIAVCIIVFFEQQMGQVIIVNDHFLFFNFFNQLPVFLFGILLYKQIQLNIIKSIFWKISVMCFGIALFYFFWNRSFGAAFFMVPLCAGAAMFGFGAILQKFNLVVPAINKIGQLSYSIYLFHFGITHYLFPALYERYLFRYLSSGTPALLGCFVLTILPVYVIAVFSKKFIEDPSVQAGNRLISRLNNTRLAPAKQNVS